MSVDDALKLAKEKELDLVAVSEQSDPPVCRIMNFGKFVFEKKKRFREQHKKQRQASHKNKEIKFHANIDVHDYSIKMKHIRAFLEKGYKVKVSLFFRGREMRNKQKGMELMERIADEIQEIGTLDSRPRLVGRNIGMYLAPISHK